MAEETECERGPGGAEPLRGGESAPEHEQSAAGEAKGRRRDASLAAERRRRRMLEEYLAAKRGRAPWKESRGPGAALRSGTMGPPAQTRSAPTPGALAPKAPLLLRPQPPRKGQKRPQGAPGGAPKAAAPNQGTPARPGGRAPSGKPDRQEGAPRPSHVQRRRSGHGGRRKAEGEKENAGVRPGQERVMAATFGPAKKARPALERVARGNSQGRPGWAPRTLARPREPAPRPSAGLGPFPAPGRPTAVSGAAAKGPGASGVQRSGASGGLLAGRGAPSARGGSGGPPKGRPQKQPPSRCLARPGGRQTRTPKGSPARGRPTAQSRRAAGKRQRSPGFERQARPGPLVSAGRAAPPGRGSPRGRRGSLKSRQPAVGPGQVLKTPSAQDRRKLLEVWLASRGKCYKRPPMASSAPKPPKRGKASLNHSFWGPMEEEEKERKELLHVASEITHTLTECQKMAEEGFPPEELLAVLSHIPEVERFAQFWICKAKLQAQQGPLDVAGLYEAAVCAGAVPLQGLRDAIAGILKTASDPAGAQPDHASVLPEEEEEEKAEDVSRSFCQEGLPWPQPRSAIKFQILPLPRAKEVKLLTPVRRSLRIESAAASYPQMLKDHDLVVSSLEEIMATDHRSQFVFRNNEALPGRVEVASFLTGLATPAKWPH